MGFGDYLKRKIIVYVLTFIFAVTLNWLLPRLMPGDPIQIMINSALGLSPQERETLLRFYEQLYGLNKPLYVQFVNFWVALFKGDLGYSILYRAPVSRLLKMPFPMILRSCFLL